MVILLYHNLVSNGELKTLYSVDEKSFTEQIQLIRGHNYQVLSLGNLLQLLNTSQDIPKKSVIITFDDGLYGNFEFAYPILKGYDIPASFFIIADRVGKIGHMGWAEIKTLFENGMEIGSHGLTHQLFDLKTEMGILNELKKSKEILEKNINMEITSFSLPRDTFNERLTADLSKKTGYKLMCLSKTGYISSSSQVFGLPRFPIRRNDSLCDFIKILENNSLKLFSYKIKELCADCLKKSLGIANYEWVRRRLLSAEYINERHSPE